MSFEFEYAGGSFSVDVPTDLEKWYIVEDEEYRPDRAQFVLEKFKEDFSSIKIGDNPEKVYALCSRSSKLNLWLAEANNQYALIQNTPTFYRDVIDPKEYEKVSAQLLIVSQKNRERASEELKAAQEYQAKISKIKSKYVDFKIDNKFAKVIALNSTSLPLTLQLAIENYTPSDADDSPTKREYARELLIRYKLNLINMIKNDADVDIDTMINKLMEK